MAEGDSSAAPSTLYSLLTHCRQNLHSSGLLSLRQLVPVHETLCQCMLRMEKESDGHDDVASSEVMDTIELLLKVRCTSSQDRDLCRKMLSREFDEEEDEGISEGIFDVKQEAERLLVIQYLIYPLSYPDSLRLVIIPFLVSETSPLISEDLELALLQWIEMSPLFSIEDTSVWRAILNTLVKSSNPRACRVLVKLVRREPQLPILIQALYDKLWKTVLAVMAAPPIWSSLHPSTTFQNHPLLSALSKDLLPLLTKVTDDDVAVATALHGPHIHKLWARLFGDLWCDKRETAIVYPETSLSAEAKNRATMLVITTILCPILPHLEHYELPLVQYEDHMDASATLPSACPLQQPALWELIHACLSQGTSALEKEGMAALSSILRRRGLFLLNTIVTTPEWKQYVMCYETLEMESEQHLVDQIWECVGDLVDKVSDDDARSFGVLTWDWMSQLFGCVLSARLPVIRKMGMHRILKANDLAGDIEDGSNKCNKKKRKAKNKSMKASVRILEKMPPDFVLQTFLPSWNSLGRTVGYTMHIELENRKLEREDMIPMMQRVLQSYVGGLNAASAKHFWRGLWDWSLQQHFGVKVFIMVFRALAEKLESTTPAVSIPVGEKELQSLTQMLESYFVTNSVVINQRREILEYTAIMLAHAETPRTEGWESDEWKPITMLRLLALYKQEYFPLESEDWSIHSESTLANLTIWVSKLGQKASEASATLAKAFVDGQLGLANRRAWDPEYGPNTNERQMAWAILLLASLVVDESTQLTTSQLIWPAINKGLSNTAGAIMTSHYINADQVTRGLLLLESGCLMRQLSGLGNGDVVLDKNTKQLMPPPPNIENMLSNAVDFCLFHIRFLMSIEANEGANGAMQTSTTYAGVVSTLRTLYQSFPSSQVISNAMDALVTSSAESILNGGEDDGHRVMHTTLIYAALSAGADLSKISYISISRSILGIGLRGDTRGRSGTWEHMARSVIFYAKWASISRILPLLGRKMEQASEEFVMEARDFLDWLLLQAFESVDATALDAVVPVFSCILEASKLWIDSENQDKAPNHFYVDTMERIVTSLIHLMQEASLSSEGVYMLENICTLLFQPRLMEEEYDRIRQDPFAKAPIRDGFRKLLQLAGSERAHINRAVLCRITVGWLGVNPIDKSSAGLNAIPYREDIVDLLVHKEVRKDESANNQSRTKIVDGTDIPQETNELSLTRAFLLVFVEKLPNVDSGLNKTVLKELLEPVILGLLVKAKPIKSSKPSLIMKGTPTYCIKMRAWQALCNLSRFVTADIAEQVCGSTFNCIQETIHSQVRYFVEIFAVRCGTIHPDIFAGAFLDQIVQTDLTLQQIASLMIMGGNWIVGRYKIDFFKPEKNGSTLRLRKVLAGAIPWLSSTQGFSRAIAQLLVYAVIPLVVDISDLKLGSFAVDNDGVLRLVYNFLSENREMARLRRKQMRFFEIYDVESVCTPKGVLSIPVDEGDEADPMHLVDVIKQTLNEVYAETHGADAPDWKQVEAIMKAQSNTVGGEERSCTEELMNFQRKIMPLDSLNLAMEGERQIKMRNAKGVRKQQLIVCASLIDKVPNLAGLARTAEIFAADRLVIPDKSVCKMDNFQNISVGAGDWIDIDQVRPEALLTWLLDRKAKGYFIFGLEQTASSVSLDSMTFPNRPTIILLGKEREGIPVELLQAVDQCIEIPQLGIIRSLNVHVSGAIAIWEHTKQCRLRKLGA